MTSDYLDFFGEQEAESGQPQSRQLASGQPESDQLQSDHPRNGQPESGQPKSAQARIAPDSGACVKSGQHSNQQHKNTRRTKKSEVGQHNLVLEVIII